MDPSEATAVPTGRASGLQEFELLQAVSRILDHTRSLEEVVSPVLAALADQLGLLHGTVTLLDRRTGEIAIDVAHGISESQRRRGRYRLGEGVTGTVVQTGRSAVVRRTSESPEFLDRTRRGRRSDVSFVCVPIRTAEEVFGALSVDRVHRPTDDLDDIARLLKIVASMLAQAVRVRLAAREERERLQEENQRLRAELRERHRPDNIVGNSKEMRDVYEQIATVSRSNASVLLLGETGTGKELVARAIHYGSKRADKPFVGIHCAALPETIIESELFGHVRGGFTGAVSDRKGRFELAHRGTLFLDEIGDIPLIIQIKLLRVLQEREFERVGGAGTQKVDVRLIAATNQDLTEMVAQGKFREDLFYRLNVFPIFVPPLRKRKTDVPLLADHFLARHARELGKPVRRLSSAAIDMLMSYHWPGNVRELESCIERAVVIAREDVIHPHHLPPTLQTAEASGTQPAGSLEYLVGAYERDLLVDALKSAGGNMAGAARILKTTPRILRYRVKQYGIDPKRYA